ncbi:uncharacterized protein LOC113502734 [Trichoplusia ni]|uniref:Uncharacterized protein LOC113502734 n=1 Tax=Trichoplusia ni TaxID=7111 RepID=A0A7E5WHI6_TRINI|nr:uncharacterized protein LOC113502734 [Trichoplusia ni]
MYRSILIVVLLSFLSCVFATTPIPTPPTATSNSTSYNETSGHCRETNPDVNRTRSLAQNCFKSIVYDYLRLINPIQICSDVNDMEINLKKHIETVKSKCHHALRTNPTIILELLRLSFKDDKFEEVYSDVKCIDDRKPAITKCIKDTVGSKVIASLNKTQKHSSWIDKSQLLPSNWSCDKADEIKTCVARTLNECKPTTRQFVESLFNISKSSCPKLNGSASATTNSDNQKPISAIIGSTTGVLIAVLVAVVIIVKIKRSK